MRNPHGMPIWYELVTPDPDAAKTFYDDVIGWTVGPRPAGDMDYRMIATTDGEAGGVFRLTDEMRQHGAEPAWMFYIGVDHVDAAVARIEQLGGKVLMPAWDIPGIGRMAMVADPQGIPFYVMRGASEEASRAYERMTLGKCNWNELTTPDASGALEFYAAAFGWTYPDKMPMGEQGDYVFVQVGEQVIGAIMPRGSEGPEGWRFYFRVPDIEQAAARVKAGGGVVHLDPTDVPGGERIIVASDPQGALVGMVAPGGGAAA